MARTNVGTAAKTSADRIKTDELALKVVEYRKRRASYSQIAQALGISRAWACTLVKREMKRAAAERLKEADYLIDMTLAELDAVAAVAWKHVAEGSEQAIMQVLKINESRRKLLGLDAAEKVDVNGIATIHFDREDESL